MDHVEGVIKADDYHITVDEDIEIDVLDREGTVWPRLLKGRRLPEGQTNVNMGESIFSWVELEDGSHSLRRGHRYVNVIDRFAFNQHELKGIDVIELQPPL